jgi:hypothetical protein
MTAKIEIRSASSKSEIEATLGDAFLWLALDFFLVVACAVGADCGTEPATLRGLNSSCGVTET